MAGRAFRGSAAEALALARLATTNSSPCRVVLKIGNRNVKAAIIDDQRDLTIATASTLERRVKQMLTERSSQDNKRLHRIDTSHILHPCLRVIEPESPLLVLSRERACNTADRSAVCMVRARMLQSTIMATSVVIRA